MTTDTHVTERQQRGIWLTIASIFGLIALFFSLFLHKINSPRIMSPEELRVNRAITFDNPRIIKEFTLVDHRGEPFELEDLKGKWSLIFFGFTHCPDICPTTLAKLAQLMKQLDSEIAPQTQVLMVSVDPARDTPELLAQYVPYFNSDFIGVTGEFPGIMSLTRNLNVAFNKVMLEDGYTVDHTGNIILVNPKGHYHGFFKPPFELARLKTTYSSIVSSF
jgi:protein SCO1/2